MFISSCVTLVPVFCAELLPFWPFSPVRPVRPVRPLRLFRLFRWRECLQEIGTEQVKWGLLFVVCVISIDSSILCCWLCSGSHRVCVYNLYLASCVMYTSFELSLDNNCRSSSFSEHTDNNNNNNKWFEVWPLYTYMLLMMHLILSLFMLIDHRRRRRRRHCSLL